MHAIIVDDEINNIQNLRYLLNAHCPEMEIVGEAKYVPSAQEAITLLNPDLLFLDIQMPGGSGFDLPRALRKYNFEVIFVTGYDQYGINAIRFSAIDHLLKPVSMTS